MCVLRISLLEAAVLKNCTLKPGQGKAIHRCCCTAANSIHTVRWVNALAENYPDLKANQNYLELQRELADTENKIQATRQFYNTVVMGLNTQIEQFPSNIIANMFGITPEKMFEIDEKEKVAPKVAF